MLPEGVLHLLRSNNLDNPTEFEDPGEEGRAHRDFGIELEVILVHGGSFHLATECRLLCLLCLSVIHKPSEFSFQLLPIRQV